MSNFLKLAVLQSPCITVLACSSEGASSTRRVTWSTSARSKDWRHLSSPLSHFRSPDAEGHVVQRWRPVDRAFRRRRATVSVSSTSIYSSLFTTTGSTTTTTKKNNTSESGGNNLTKYNQRTTTVLTISKQKEKVVPSQSWVCRLKKTFVRTGLRLLHYLQAYLCISLYLMFLSFCAITHRCE